MALVRRAFFSKVCLLCLFAAVFTPSNSFARKTAIGDVFPSLMRGVRPLGMGNAFVAMPGSDAIAPFYNPAAINDFSEERIYTVGVPMLDFNPNFFGAFYDLYDLKHKIKTHMPANQKIAIFNNYVKKYTGEFTSLYSQMPLFQVRHKFYTLSAVADSRTVVSFRNQVFPNVDYKTAQTVGIVAGSAVSVIDDDSLQIGLNGKLLVRMGKEDEITSADIVINSIQKLIGFQTWQKGVGFGFDLGAKYRLPFWQDSLQPTIAVTGQDIGGTRFSGNAPTMPMSLSVGAGIFPSIGSIKLAILADVRELQIHQTFMKKFHFGVEATFPKNRLFTPTLRAGCDQVYPSVGATLKFPKLVSFLFAFYGEEAGHYSTTKPIWRLSNQLVFEF